MSQKDRQSVVMSYRELTEAMGELLKASTLPEFNAEQWRAVIRFSGDVMVVAQLHQWLCSRGLLAQMDDEVVTYLHEVGSLNAVRVEQLIKTFHRFAHTLNQVGVEPIVLKGLALLVGNEPNHALFKSRITYDVDALISRTELQASISALKMQGYRQLSHYINMPAPSADSLDHFTEIDLSDFRNSNEYSRAHVPPFLDSESVCSIDLHTLVASSESPAATRLTTLMIERSTRVCNAANNSVYRVPDPSAQIVLAVYHSQIKNRYHYLGQIDWRLLMDFRAMLDIYPEAAFVEEIMEFSQSIGLDNEMYTVMALLNQYLGADINLRAYENTTRSQSYVWFDRRLRWAWLSKTCRILVLIKKSTALISPRELRHALGGRPKVTDFLAHLAYRLRRSLKS